MIADFGMCVWSAHSSYLFSRAFVSAKHLHGPDEQLYSVAGSFGYVAPEVLTKKGHSKKVDIWSTGLAPFIFFWIHEVESNYSRTGLSPTSCYAATRPSVRMIRKNSSVRLRSAGLLSTIATGRTSLPWRRTSSRRLLILILSRDCRPKKHCVIPYVFHFACFRCALR